MLMDCNLPLLSADRAAADKSMSCSSHIWWIACGAVHPEPIRGPGPLLLHSPQSESSHCASLHCPPRVLVQSSRESDRCWSHALLTCTAAHAATLQGGLQTLVPRPLCALQSNTLIYSNDSPAAKAGASATLTVLVNNTDAPPSDLPLEGAHLHLLMMAHTM